jgi:hypothetical protein
MTTKISALLLCVLLVLSLGCRTVTKVGSDSPGSTPGGSFDGPSGASPEAPPSSSGGGSSLSVTDASGKPVLLVASGRDRYDVSGPRGTVGTLRVVGEAVTIEDLKSQKIGSVKRADGELKVDDASGAKVAELSPKEGGWRLKNGGGTTLLKIKPKDYGFKVGDDQGNSIAKIKRKGGVTELSNDSGQLLYKVSGAVRPDATGVLCASQLSPLQQAALMVAAGR